MQAIQVRFCGPTNTQGSRYIARCEAARLVHPASYDRNPYDNATTAASKLLVKLGWTTKYYGQWVGGQLPNGDWVFVSDSPRSPRAAALDLSE
jgi:hypothetical protein